MLLSCSTHIYFWHFSCLEKNEVFYFVKNKDLGLGTKQLRCVCCNQGECHDHQSLTDWQSLYCIVCSSEEARRF